MSVVLTRDQIESILSLYHLDAPEAFGGSDRVPAAYWVRVQGRKYVLRMSQRRSIDDMMFEKELLAMSARADLAVPRLLQNVAKGTFTPWARRGRFVSLFTHPEGRQLGRFEIRPDGAGAVGAWLGAFHRQTRAFHRFKRPEASPPGVLLDRLERALERRRLARRHAETVRRLRAWERSAPLSTVLPKGPTHLALTLSNVLFRDGRLTGVVGFERAATDAFVVDVAGAIHEWCWLPDPEPGDGPRGHFEAARVRAFLTQYEAQRRLTVAEWRALPHALTFTAVREAARRLADHELRGSRAARPYRDHRHHLARLEALSELSLDAARAPAPS